jgi:hypothetical protein
MPCPSALAKPKFVVDPILASILMFPQSHRSSAPLLNALRTSNDRHSENHFTLIPMQISVNGRRCPSVVISLSPCDLRDIDRKSKPEKRTKSRVSRKPTDQPSTSVSSNLPPRLSIPSQSLTFKERENHRRSESAQLRSSLARIPPPCLSTH